MEAQNTSGIKSNGANDCFNESLLLRCIQAGDVSARDILLLKYLSVVRAVASIYAGNADGDEYEVMFEKVATILVATAYVTDAQCVTTCFLDSFMEQLSRSELSPLAQVQRSSSSDVLLVRLARELAILQPISLSIPIGEDGQIEDLVPDSQPPVLDQIIESQVSGRVQRALKDLEPLEQRVVELVLQEREMETIAQELGLRNKERVKQKYWKALRRLAHVLGDLNPHKTTTG